VQLQTALFGLTQAFNEKYGDEALKVSEAFIEKLGIKMGTQIKEKEGITGSGIEDIEKLFIAFTRPLSSGAAAKSMVEGNKLTIIRESPSLCPGIYVAKQLKAPLETVCQTVNFPMMRGVAKAVNPNAKQTSIQLSEDRCEEIIEVP